jgi:hypothetical protein
MAGTSRGREVLLNLNLRRCLCLHCYGVSASLLKSLLVICIATNVSIAAEQQSEVATSTNGLAQALQPYVFAAYSYDSNLFKLPDEISLPDGLADQYTTIGVGFDSKFKRSRQKFKLLGNVYRNSYKTYDENDYTGGRAEVEWDWVAGQAVSGDLGYTYDRRLRNFANQVVLNRQRDLRTENKVFADADITFLQHWIAGVRGKFSQIEFSSTELLNLDRTTGGASLNYKTRAENTFGLDGEFTSGDYDNNSNLNFDEYFLGGVMEWKFTGKSKLQGKLGYSRRQNDDATRVDYDDFTGRFTWVTKGSPGNRVKASIWRELSNLSDEIANFALVHGVSVEPQWQAASKLSLRFRLLYENRDFKGELGSLPSGFSSREDEIYSGGIWADWQVVKYLAVSIGLTADTRSSNRVLEEYDDRIAQVLFKAGF